MKPERIAKRLARAGLCSRREAEAWIRAGRVAVDGKVLDTPAITVTAASSITVDGAPLPEAAPTRLWRYHKPAGLVTTSRDPQGRPTVFERLPPELPRVVSVGRLDLASEGLLLLTNDGELARRLELPATGWLRRYRVRVRGRVDAKRLAALADGIEIDGVRYGPIRAALDRQLATNAWLTMALAEGKNREVRRVCEHLGWPVQRLIRVGYGPFQLGDLAPGAVAEVPSRILREQTGGGKSARQGGDERKWAKPRAAAKRKPTPIGPGKPPPPRPSPADGGRGGRKAGSAQRSSTSPAGEAETRGTGTSATRHDRAPLPPGGGVGEGVRPKGKRGVRQRKPSPVGPGKPATPRPSPADGGRRGTSAKAGKEAPSGSAHKMAKRTATRASTTKGKGAIDPARQGRAPLPSGGGVGEGVRRSPRRGARKGTPRADRRR